MDWKTKAGLFRSRFYGRQDVYGRLWEMRRDGKDLRGYAPVCDNRWQDFCHLKNKSGTPCSSCDHQKWTPVSDETVVSHIKGDEAHIYYVLLPDGTICFGAIDFDMKDGKEDKGYGFDDVKRTSDILWELGVHHSIARSTGRGYHLYVFFDKAYPANKFRSFILDVFDRAGFIDLVQQGIKPLPEYFPKQSYTSRDGIGNGIKPPMVESRFRYGRNCWVDENDKPIGDGLSEEDQIAEQWKYFEGIIPQSADLFDKILECYNIEVEEEVHSGGAIRRSAGRRKSYSGDSTDDKWQQPLSGSIEKVLEGCAALRKVRDKTLKGETLGHNEGFGLYHLCMHTRDGRAWFEKNVTGWGETPTDARQLEHSIEKNYMAWTCRKFQELGVCPAGTQCFEKKPPREIVDGMEVLRVDLPKEQWPEPSPIRYAYGKGEDFLLKLQAEVLELKNEKDVAVKTDKLKQIAQRVQVFDESQQKEFKAFVREQKTLKRNELAKVFNEAADTHEAEAKTAIKAREDIVVVDDNYYIKENFGYSYIKSVKEGKTKNIRICSVDIVIKKEVNYYEDSQNTKSVYHGFVKAQGLEKDFSIDVDIWADNSTFQLFFMKVLGTRFNPLRQNLELIKQAAAGFSAKAGITCEIYLQTQGYYGDSYLMPSCIVDQNGIRPNTNQHVDLKNKETKNLDFQLLGESDLKEVLMHLKVDFLTAWPDLWTYTGLAHTLMPCVMDPMDWTKRTTLFYEGLTGTGKSELTHTLQFFWGQFDSIANFMSSPKGIRELGYQFKDANVVVDDYKGLTREQVAAVRETILHAYDGTTDYKLQRTSELRVGKLVRGIYTMSGEEFVTNDAAVIARTILVEVDKQNTKLTQDKYEAVHKNRHNYNGITPQFISWFLKQDKKQIQKQATTTRQKLKEDFHGAQNVDRISVNLAANYTVWTLFTQFLVDMGVATSGEKEAMDFRHWGNVQKLRSDMVERCASEQGSEVFLRVLNQMMMTGEVTIKDLPGHMHDYKVMIGYVPKEQPEGGAIHLYPDVTFEAIKNFSKNQPIYGTKKSIGRQFADQDVLSEKDRGHATKNVRQPGGRQIRVWSLRPEALGLDPEVVLSKRGTSEPAKEGRVIEFRKVMSTTEEDLKIF
jgi:hypothetical protein